MMAEMHKAKAPFLVRWPSYKTNSFMCWFIFKKKIFKKFSLWKWIAWKNIQVYSDIWVCLWQNQQNDLCALESDQSGHLASLIGLRCLHEVGIRPVWSVFAVHMKNHWVLGYPYSAQWRLWSDWADAQADLSLRWARSCFVVLSWGGSFLNSSATLILKPHFIATETIKFISCLLQWK